MDSNFAFHTLAERVARVETQMETQITDFKEVKEKLDQLIQLKHQGMGAISLISILIGSGVLGLIATVMAMLKGGNHL